jgi:predicted ArsR family transcriptional regulator
MTRQAPLRLRVVDALRLQPMTVRELAHCLGAREDSIRKVLDGAEGVIRIGTRRCRMGRPQVLFGAESP